VSEPAEILFFGCLGRAGHYLKSKSNPSIRYHETAWGNSLDGGILEGKSDFVNGECVVAKKDGWTAVNFWDRSGGDTRPGCHTCFLAHADISGQQLIELAKVQWPEVFSRHGFPTLKLPDVVPA
jgi:hypothetical protein